jgi:hypothetical protein
MSAVPPDDELGFLRQLLEQQQASQLKHQQAMARQQLDWQIAQQQAAAAARSVSPAAALEQRRHVVGRDDVAVAPRRSERRRTARAKATAIFTGEAVDRTAIGIMKYGAVALLAVSFAGSVVALNGGWQPVIDAWPRPWLGINPLAAAVGVGLQSWITLIEWHKRDDKLSLLYLTHLAIDTVLTWLGYVPVLGPFFAGGLGKLGVEGFAQTLSAGAIVAVLALILAKLPEEMLVD